MATSPPCLCPSSAIPSPWVRWLLTWRLTEKRRWMNDPSTGYCIPRMQDEKMDGFRIVIVWHFIQRLRAFQPAYHSRSVLKILNCVIWSTQAGQKRSGDDTESASLPNESTQPATKWQHQLQVGMSETLTPQNIHSAILCNFPIEMFLLVRGYLGYTPLLRKKWFKRSVLICAHWAFQALISAQLHLRTSLFTAWVQKPPRWSINSQGPNRISTSFSRRKKGNIQHNPTVIEVDSPYPEVG